MIRKVDRLGRIVIPKEWRDHSGMCPEEEIYMSYNEDTREITVKRYESINECVICHQRSIMSLMEFKGKSVCKSCIDEIKEK